MQAKLLQSCPTLWDLMDCSPPHSSVHGILQARILEWAAMPLPGDLPDPDIEPTSLVSPSLAGRFFTISASWEAPPREEPAVFPQCDRSFPSVLSRHVFGDLPMAFSCGWG